MKTKYNASKKKKTTKPNNKKRPPNTVDLLSPHIPKERKIYHVNERIPKYIFQNHMTK